MEIAILHFFKTIEQTKDFDCLDCGACCEYYVVRMPKKDFIRIHEKYPHMSHKKFSWLELETIHYMNGGEKFATGRCCALTGKVGESVSCSIYEDRSEVCKNFPKSTLEKKNKRCLFARKYHGLEI